MQSKAENIDADKWWPVADMEQSMITVKT